MDEPTTPRPTRMQVTLDDLDLLDDWLDGQHERALEVIDEDSVKTTDAALDRLRKVRVLQRKVADARERCLSPREIDVDAIDPPDQEVTA